ncbi:MAG: ABC transporter ATP-binding protein [Chloroflexi bacterium]|nr:ABC transporter ATP-binding protein [Chloroflexota bacterium]
MLRLLKYFKPYILLILITIAVLYVQAQANLALPDYMSDIINVGIQQGGVEDAVPLAIRQSEMDKLMLFMSEEDKTTVMADYALIDSASPDFETYLAEYPALANEAVYVLTDSDKTEIEKLNPIMGKALLTVSTIDQVIADPAKASAMPQTGGFDLSRLPAGSDIYALLSSLPQAQLTQITSAIDQQFASMSDSMIVQSAAATVRAEYAALGVDLSKLQTNYIVRIGGLMLLVTLLAGVTAIVVGYLASRIAAGVARNVRRDTFKKVESFSKAEFDKFSTASLITRTTNDVTQVQAAVMMLIRMAIYAPIMGAGAVIHAVDKSPSLTWIIALGVVLLLGLILIVFSVAMPKFKIIQSLIDRLNLVMRENLSGMMVIRAFNNQKFEEDRFDKANLDLTQTNLFVNRVMVVMMPLMTLLMNGLSLLIIWVGAHEIAQSMIQVGDMMAFLQYAMQVVTSFLMLSIMFIILPRASISANRIADVLDADISIKDPEKPRRFKDDAVWKIEFRHVSFRYPDAEEDVLHDINFTALPGQTTAIIGSTGSGKSTVINLIPRFYDVTGGQLFIDGMDVREVKQSDLRDKIGYIPQKGTLFSGTIESNLRYADENASMDTLKKAADVAQASEFIDSIAEGLNSDVSQGGTNVSGGQKQRLAIARALVKKPPIYIFDDSFSALDFKTDLALRKALKEYTGSSTVLIVAQRISTIKNAEQIVVLDEGRVVGVGTHQELMKSCQTYREIALSQLSMEELA